MNKKIRPPANPANYSKRPVLTATGTPAFELLVAVMEALSKATRLTALASPQPSVCVRRVADGLYEVAVEHRGAATEGRLLNLASDLRRDIVDAGYVVAEEFPLMHEQTPTGTRIRCQVRNRR